MACPSPEELLELAESLDREAACLDSQTSKTLESAANQVGKSWSGSWLGYHSRIYYENFDPVPPGARFSVEWGTVERISNDTVGSWAEYTFDGVVEYIYGQAGSPDIESLDDSSATASRFFEESRSQLNSFLSQACVANPEDAFLIDLAGKVEGETLLDYSGFVSVFRGKYQFFSRDYIAVGQGILTPPHLYILAQCGVRRSAFAKCADLAKHARRAAAHLARNSKRSGRAGKVGTHVFIGHGRAPAWKDFRDFVRDRLGLPWDEFNRVPVAGIQTTTRLLQMLDDAAIAFLILTAEDEQTDGKFHPRMNVVHEVGLFQGRLGPERAILLLEEGCEEFSNVHGLGQIRFPKGDIGHVFEDVRRVLEREEIIAAA